MKRFSSLVFGILLATAIVAFCPRVSHADGGCQCGKTVTVRGTVINAVTTSGNHYYLWTSLGCGQGNYKPINIKGQGTPPSSCKPQSFFKATGIANCSGIYEIDITPSNLTCRK